MRTFGLVLLVPSLALAQPPSQFEASSAGERTAGVEEREPPPPVWMAELTARKRLNFALLGSTAVVVNLGQIGVYAAYAIENLEAGAEIRARGWREIFDGTGGANTSNLALKARYNIHVDKLTFSPGVTLWAPIVTGELEHWNDLTRMSAVDDGRMYIDEGALGVALAAAYRSGPSFVQGEGGAAFVQDNGPQIASVFAAAGVGKTYSGNIAFMLEWRSEWFPIDQRLMSFGFGMLRETKSGAIRLRFHPYTFEDEWGGVACGFDLLRSFE